MLTAKKIRKINPSGSLDAVLKFLQSENDTVWSTAVELAGLWKLESARTDLETILKQTDSKQVRKNAAINSLIAMGGEKTRKFFDEQIQNPKVSYPLKSILIKGQMKIQPILAARRAVNLISEPSEGQEPNDSVLCIYFQQRSHPGTDQRTCRKVTTRRCCIKRNAVGGECTHTTAGSHRSIAKMPEG